MLWRCSSSCGEKRKLRLLISFIRQTRGLLTRPALATRVAYRGRTLIRRLSNHLEKRANLGSQRTMTRMHHIETSSQRLRIEDFHYIQHAAPHLAPHRHLWEE